MVGRPASVPKGEPWRSLYAPGFPERHPEHVAEDLRGRAAASPRIRWVPVGNGKRSRGGACSNGWGRSCCRRWCCTAPRTGDPGGQRRGARVEIPRAELVILEGAGHVYRLGTTRGGGRRGPGLRAAASMSAPPEVVDLAERRAAARAAKDFAAADALRDELAGRRVDGGRRCRAVASSRRSPADAGAGPSTRRRCRGRARRTGDRGRLRPLGLRGMARRHRARRSPRSARTRRPGRVQLVVADVTGAAPPTAGATTSRSVPLEEGTGLGRGAQRRAPTVARRASSSRSTARSSRPATGSAPLAAALADRDARRSSGRSGSSRATSGSSTRRPARGRATRWRAT